MVTEALLQPESIVVIGASNDIRKPGGKVLKNIIDGGYKGKLYVSNPKEEDVQGIRSYRDADDLPDCDLAIMAIAARFIPDTARVLTKKKNTRAIIILSAGFSEESEAGKQLEDELVDIVNAAGCSLIGPNCIGVLTPAYHGVFTLPIPHLDMGGCDFISGSGATACFIMEAGIPQGLRFARVFSVGNSAQMGVEDILKYMDETFDPDNSPRVKLLYIENISDPEKLRRHASSLIQKGCRIAAIKAGTSEAGSRAASSHTGALASPDVAVEALFRKAGIVRCYSREELIQVAAVFMHPPLKGKNIAVITHAGGPAVMLTDALEKNGLTVPPIQSTKSNELLELLFPGSSVANPIDFLATGTAEQLGTIIDYTDHYFEEIDGMAVIFGTPGLFPIFDVYQVLDEKMKQCKKPIFPVLPSTLTASNEVDAFLQKGRVNFPDEVAFGKALARVFFTPPPAISAAKLPVLNRDEIRKVIDDSESGYLGPGKVQQLLDLAGIPRVMEVIARSEEELALSLDEIGFPCVMKVIGPVHKSDVGGVALGIGTDEEALSKYRKMMKIPEAGGVLLQPMMKGLELFAGVKRDDQFGHLILFGMGGIFIEVLRDIVTGIAPIDADEAGLLLRQLKSYPLLEGVRGQEGVDIPGFANIIARISALVKAAPEIFEMDINPLIAGRGELVAVDARVRLEK